MKKGIGTPTAWPAPSSCPSSPLSEVLYSMMYSHLLLGSGGRLSWVLGCGRAGRGPYGLLPRALLFIASVITARTPPFTEFLLLPDPAGNHGTAQRTHIQSHLVAPERTDRSVKAPSDPRFLGGFGDVGVSCRTLYSSRAAWVGCRVWWGSEGLGVSLVPSPLQL